MGRQVFTAGEILTAASMNDLGDATVMVFDDATARATAIPTPVEGMVTYLKDTDEVDKFDGSAFVPVGIAPAILQVVSTTLTTPFTTASTTFTAITGLTASITPSSTSSKILAIVGVEGGSTNSVGGSNAGFRLMRDSTPIGIGTDVSARIPVTGALSTRGTGSGSFMVSSTKSVLDTPATASAITYSVEVRIGGGTVFVNRPEVDTDDVSQRPVSTLTLMEVAG